MNTTDIPAAGEIDMAVAGAVATVTLNRPEKLNAATSAMLDQLPVVLGEVAERRDVRVLVLTGAGDAFCAGADIGSRSTLSGPAGVAELRTRADAVRILAGLPQITVAAVNGACAGMGTALAAACDLRLLASRSRIATGYLRIGVPGDFGGLYHLSRIVGRSRALEWYVRPRKIEPDEASSTGFANAVFDDETFADGVAKWCADLLSLAPLALRAVKANLLDQDRLALEEYLDEETQRHVAVRASADAREGTAAFLTKTRLRRADEGQTPIDRPQELHMDIQGDAPEGVADSPVEWIREHIRRYVETDGAEGADYLGYRALLLTTVGRRSDVRRRTALYYGRDGDDYLLVASRGGDPNDPSWYLNLDANPEVEVQVGGEVFAARARTVEGAERVRLWQRMVETFPRYAEYQERTTRQIPVVVLRRTG
jgi:2-(1,2-epoxy-1,2-dihydrophenyl)acetyl-CoA isomerase